MIFLFYEIHKYNFLTPKTMKKTIALAAIVMVAVVMGMSAFAPAVMAMPPGNGQLVAVCHADKGVDGEAGGDDDGAVTIWVPQGAANVHTNLHTEEHTGQDFDDEAGECVT